MDCNIKESGKAWNDGLDAFSKAFKQTGGKTSESIRFALDEIKNNNPDFKFDQNSFIDPLVESLKEKDIIPKNYKFKDGKSSSAETKIKKVSEKLKGLTPDEQKSFARKAFSAFEKDGLLDNDDVRNIYSDVVGIPAMNEKVESQIANTSKALVENKELEDSIQKEIKAMQADKDANGGKLTSEQDKEYTKKFQDMGAQRTQAQSKVLDETAKFSEMLKENKFWLHQLTDYMPLNLMNPNSLIKNVSGAAADFIIRSMGNTMAPIVSKAASIFTGVHSNPFGAKVEGVLKAKSGEKAKLAWKHGVTDFNNELPMPNHLRAGARFRQAMDATGKERFKGVISALLKVHPNLISKGLTVPDAIVYEAVKSSEMNRIAEAKGFKGAEKEAFMLSPDEKSTEVATKLAQKATFKQDLPDWMSGIKKLSSYDPHEQSKKLIAAGMSPLAAKVRTGLRAIIQKSAVPFIKTPINIVRTASKILLPEYGLAEDLIAAKNETDAVERQRLIVEGTTKFVAGMFVRNIALQMVSMGLISAGFGDEDKKSKDIVEQESGGPNRINYSALVRGLSFRGVEKQKGDKYVDLNSLGAFGIVMAVYAHAFSKYDKEEIAERTQYNKNLMNTAYLPTTLAWSGMSSSLDFTFFTGINQLQGAIMNKQGYEASSLATNYAANLFTGVVPSTAQKFSMQSSPDVKKQFDKELPFHENLANVLGYRFAFQSDNLKNKYFSLAEQGKTGKKKKESLFFDNYMGRVLEAEFDFAKVTTAKTEDPISKLREAMRDVDKDERDKLFPSAINQNISIPYKRGGKTKSEKVNLTEDQYEFLQERASTYRMMLATPFIMSEDFQKADHDTRSKVLQEYYQEGLKNAKQDLKKQYPDLKSQSSGTTDSKAVKKLHKKHAVK